MRGTARATDSIDALHGRLKQRHNTMSVRLHRSTKLPQGYVVLYSHFPILDRRTSDNIENRTFVGGGINQSSGYLI
jgi:hypothetical protein